MKKIRLLDALCRLQPEIPRERHFSRILCGEVIVHNSIIKDPKYLLDKTDELSFVEKEYVSRGAYKLLTAFTEWNIEIKDRVMLDAGASTGGFTDLLLKYGAERVYAVDVGYNQLDYSLRQHPQVIVKERTNIMEITSLDPQPWGAVADLSFRSLTGAIEKIIDLTSGKWCIALIKPQFEIEKHTPGFDGIVRSKETIREILSRILSHLEGQGLRPVRLIPSRLTGTQGNQEFLVCVDQMGVFFDSKAPRLVEDALETAFPD